jgi:hypothetical protein
VKVWQVAVIAALAGLGIFAVASVLVAVESVAAASVDGISNGTHSPVLDGV